jgi:membrane protein
VAIAGAVFGQAAARGQIATDISSIVGTRAARAIETIILNAHNPGSGIWSTVLGIVVLLLGASGVFVELQSAMNTIWKVAPKTGEGVMTFIRQRFASFAMVLVVALLLFASLLLSAVIPVVGKYLAGTMLGGPLVWQLINASASVALATLLFALIFKVVPDIDVAWRDVWPGAFVTAILFTLGKLILAIYIENSSVTTSYGAAGSLVALVIWVYCSSQIVFFGAELTEVYSRRIGTGGQPTEHALLLQRPTAGSNVDSQASARPA